MMFRSIRKIQQASIRQKRLVLVTALAVLTLACEELRPPKVEPFYAVTVPPRVQELRWSNGNAPKSLDPAMASAAPETDIVRAIYEGLTDLDSRSLRETPGVAERWESSEDLKTWTFYLRKDARWSNGERVTAKDFVASWKRLAGMREKATSNYLFQNIVGMRSRGADPATGEPLDFLPPVDPAAVGVEPRASDVMSQVKLSPAADPAQPQQASPSSPVAKTPAQSAFGVEAVDEQTLKVSLVLPDKDLPRLVAHPVFRPVYEGGAGMESGKITPDVVTNGAFRIVRIGEDGVSLERSESYWNREAVALERIRFVPASSAENALEAYKRGEVDIVTNAAFEPLALKLLAPYEDFRRTTHSALNFYEFNTEKAPFSDRRVREALAIAIDRAKLTDGDLEGTNQPAYSFFPLGERRNEALALDTLKAKDLLEKAGFAGGEGFPVIRLVINRNNTQNRIARSVARMWKQNLNIETEIVVREAKDMDEVRQQKDYDLLRRGIVLPTNDELVNLESVLGSARKPPTPTPAEVQPEDKLPTPDPRIEFTDPERGPLGLTAETPTPSPTPATEVLSEADAVFDLRVIPLYFPTSYSLVKPYVRGFEVNGLDAPSLKEVSIDSNWQPRTDR